MEFNREQQTLNLHFLLSSEDGSEVCACLHCWPPGNESDRFRALARLDLEAYTNSIVSAKWISIYSVHQQNYHFAIKEIFRPFTAATGVRRRTGTYECREKAGCPRRPPIGNVNYVTKALYGPFLCVRSFTRYRCHHHYPAFSLSPGRR